MPPHLLYTSSPRLATFILFEDAAPIEFQSIAHLWFNLLRIDFKLHFGRCLIRYFTWKMKIALKPLFERLLNRSKKSEVVTGLPWLAFIFSATLGIWKKLPEVLVLSLIVPWNEWRRKAVQLTYRMHPATAVRHWFEYQSMRSQSHNKVFLYVSQFSVEVGNLSWPAD